MTEHTTPDRTTPALQTTLAALHALDIAEGDDRTCPQVISWMSIGCN